MGRKKAWGVSDGTWVLLIRLKRLDALAGRSGFEFPVDNRVGGGPRRDEGGWAEPPAGDAIEEPPSWEAISVMREEMPSTEGGRGTSSAGDGKESVFEFVHARAWLEHCGGSGGGRLYRLSGNIKHGKLPLADLQD